MKGRNIVSTSWLTIASCACLALGLAEPLTAQKATTIPSLRAYDEETRRTIELACALEKTNGPVAYGACLDRQIATLRTSPGIPNLRGYDDETRRTMELACAMERTNGPVAYGGCLRRQIEGLRPYSKPP